MKRPYISISGTLDELILMEAILAYYYTVPYDEKWNNDALEFTVSPVNHLVCNPATGMGYHSHPGFGVNKIFKASQLTEILTYIEEYERRNS